MPRALLLPLLVITVVCSASAQSLSNNNGRPHDQRTAALKKIRGSQAFQLSAELTRQQKFLGDVAARFEAVSVHDLTPMLSYSYVWSALRENRIRLANSNRRLTSTQAKLIEQGYDTLETEVLLQFVEHQLSVLHETLELEESQYDQIENSLSLDLNKKRALLTATGITSTQFAARLGAVSEQTEATIVSILDPEQRKKFYKHLTINRDRLVG